MSDYKWKPFTLLVSAEEVENTVGVKLEAGKYYKTRDGRKVGPLKQSSTDFFGFEGFATWYFDGNSTSYRKNEDIVSEYTPELSPIREVIRRELVAGQYGRVLVDEKGYVVVGICHKPEEIREAAHILNQIAEYLESEGK